MQEKDFNRDIVRKFNSYGWGYKIPDPDKRSMSSGGKRPFDGVAFVEKTAIYFESKLIKNKLSAFSLDKIEGQQYSNLLRLKVLGAETVVLVAYWVSRKEYSVIPFDIQFLWNLKNTGRKSILGEELKEYYEQGKFFDMRTDFNPIQLIKKRVKELPRKDKKSLKKIEKVLYKI